MVFGLALLLLALGPRWVARDTYVTHDEDQWMRRAGGFAYGIKRGLPGSTYQSGHPGVLTMELAMLGQGPGRAERFADGVTGYTGLVSGVPGYFDALLDARRAFALATAALVAVLALLAWRLFGPGPALVGGILLALDPFYLAHSQLVHTDALLAGLTSAAALCGLVRWGSGGGRRWVVVGGVASGLALLAKVSASYLGAFIPLLALALGRGRGARALAADIGLWGAAGLATLLALWPSLWVNPGGTLTQVLAFGLDTGGRPHRQGSFFLGQPVFDPGPLFYPVAGLLRLSPGTILGLLALAWVAWRSRDSLTREQWRVVRALLAYTLGFGLLMTLGAKKFDRYLLPAFPALDLLAGLGLWLVLRAPLARVGERERWHVSLSPTLLVSLSLVLALAAWPLASVFPHYLTYYNPLLGGGPVAVRAILVGQGEGLSEAARWLNSRPDAGKLTVAAHSADVLQATFVGRAFELRDRVPESADYVALYVYQTQIRREPRVQAEYARRRPEHVVRLNGIEYARIYRGPRASGRET